MDKNTQQILHSLSIKIQGQLLSTLLPEGMYKQRKGNMHVLIQTEARTHMVAPSAPSSCCSRRCHWWPLSAHLEQTAVTAVLSAALAVFLSPTWQGCRRHAAAFVLRRRYNVIYFHYEIVYQKQHDLLTFNNGRLTPSGLFTSLQRYRLSGLTFNFEEGSVKVQYDSSVLLIDFMDIF